MEGRARTAHAQRLVEHLNSHGGRWGPIEWAPSDARTECGVDAAARDEEDNRLFQIQTTVVEREAWPILGRGGVHEHTHPLESAVQCVRQAIVDKQFRPKRDIVLALDATDAVTSALPAVVDKFGAQQGAWAAGLGYDAIWIVGPPSFVTRLDP